MQGTHQALHQDNDDVERQVEVKGSPPQANIEDTISTRSKLTQLGFYFLCNVSLTIYNKLILGKFPHPWLLTALHAGSASVGCYVLRMRGGIPMTHGHLDTREETKLLALSVLFTVNIAISNVSLAMVSVPFHQILRSTTPVITVAIYRIMFGRSYSNDTYLSLVPIVLGVAMTTYGEYYFTTAGFLLTSLGVVLAAAKTIATNRVMTGTLKLSPLETLLRMSPLAFLQALFIAWLSGELSDALASVRPAPSEPQKMPLGVALALLGNGILAFALNVCSFTANKAAGALTMTVCGNIKQCLTVLLGIVLFDVSVGLTNGLGMVVSLAGAAWYSAVELRAKTPGAE